MNEGAPAVLDLAASRLQALAPAVLAAQLSLEVAAAGDAPPVGLQGQAFQLPLQLANGPPMCLQLWLSDGLLRQQAAGWNHTLSPDDIGRELVNVLAGQLLAQLAHEKVGGSMGLPVVDEPGTSATATAPWWRCQDHWLQLGLATAPIGSRA